MAKPIKKSNKTVTFNCDYCGKSHTHYRSLYNKSKSGKHFCSDKCYRQERAARRYKLNCPVCGVEFTRRECDFFDSNTGKKHKNLYCSRKCKTDDQTGGDEYSTFQIFVTGARTRMFQNGTRHLLDFNKKDLKELWDAQGGKCAISGIPMTLDIIEEDTKVREMKRTKTPYKASLDRIDSNKPYTKDNIQFVCMAVNFMKNEFDNDEIIEFVSKMS
jgi:hypothetical protein